MTSAWRETLAKRRLEMESWLSDALCSRHPSPEVFFPNKGDAKQVVNARITCRQCPVSKECLAFAIKHSEQYGIWGGLTEEERIDIRMGRTDNVKVCVTCNFIRVFFDTRAKECDSCKGIERRKRRKSLNQQTT